ncbi:hypothetical protein TRIP_E160213 [uncultured Spirochaetota bacterium]|nr:hypothetical protein TRIP_E160213 [uncultured Spirochaetota bacterium]
MIQQNLAILLYLLIGQEQESNLLFPAYETGVESVSLSYR